MHRQRKKDLNLKPNRVLDKRSSRGMIYENEELRLRTIAISDDVDRGHNDIKKLRKENDHLKREIWSLRDECEKLEDILKRMVNSGHPGASGLDPNDLPYPELFLEGEGDQRESWGEGDESSMMEDEEHMTLMRNMFMMDDDQNDTGSVIEQPFASTSTSEDGHHPHLPHAPHPHHSWGHTAIPPELEKIREETDSVLRLAAAISCPASSCDSSSPINPEGNEDNSYMALPDPNLLGFDNPNYDSLNILQENTPLIQITPASSSSSNPCNLDDQDHQMISPIDINSSQESIQEGGCVTELPKMFQVTSEIQFDNGDHPQNQNDKEIMDLSQAVLISLPPTSPSTSQKLKSKGNKSIKGGNAFKSSAAIAVCGNGGSSTYRHSFNGDNGNGSGGKSLNNRIMHSPSAWRNPGGGILPSVNPLGGNNIGFVGNGSCPNFNFCYQSEPSLTTNSNNGASGGGGGGASDHFAALSFDPLNPFMQCFPYPTFGLAYPKPTGWNSIDKNLAVGYISTGNGNAEGIQIKSQDIIDELEIQFDPSLEKVKGIRLLPGRVFISLKDSTDLINLLSQFGTNCKEFWVKEKYKILFMDGSERYSEVTLSGVPPDMSDLTVISVLNQYGQVVSPLNKNNYKGIDISERIGRIHLVKRIPVQLTIGGYEVAVAVISSNEIDIDSSLIPDKPEVCCIGLEMDKSQNGMKDGIISGNTSSTCHNSCARSQTTKVVTCHHQAIPVTSQIPQISGDSSPTEHNQSHVVSKPGQIPSSPAVVPVGGLKPHKAVTRSTSSNPRLETGAAPPSPVFVNKRMASVCTENISPEAHPSKMFSQSQQGATAHTTSQSQPIHPNTLKVTGGTNSAPNLLPLNPKKPLSRLMRSSPGALPIPPNPGAPPSKQNIDGIEPANATASHQSATGQPSIAANSTTSGLRAAFYKSLSIDPRRGSNASQQHGENNNNNNFSSDKYGYGAYSRRSSANVGSGRVGMVGQAQHQMLSQMNSNSSSSYDKGGKESLRRFGSNNNGPKEPLPWCGCWGNGCI